MVSEYTRPRRLPGAHVTALRLVAGVAPRFLQQQKSCLALIGCKPFTVQQHLKMSVDSVKVKRALLTARRYSRLSSFDLMQLCSTTNDQLLTTNNRQASSSSSRCGSDYSDVFIKKKLTSSRICPGRINA
jgi:hypothetical protein